MLEKFQQTGHSLRALFVLGAILIICVYCPAQPLLPSIEAVSALIRTGQYRSAVKASEEALQETPGDPRLFTLKAIALSKLGQAAEALTAFQSALNLHADYVPALAGAAELEYKLGNNDAAHYLDRLLSLKPQDQVAHAMRAVLAAKAGDCPAAVEHFAKAPDQIGSQAVALHEYGVCLARLQRYDEATSVFRRFHQLTPNDSASLYALASIQLINKDYQGVVNTLEPSVRGAADARTLEMASVAYEALGDTPQAVSSLRQAILLNPDRPELYVEFSSLSLDHKSYQVGIDMIDAGLSRLSRSSQLYLARGVLYAQIGQYEKAEKDFTMAALLDPKEALASHAQALAEIQANRLDEALKTLESRREQNPRDPFVYYLLAEVLTKKGAQPHSAEFFQALAAARKAVELKPDFVLARDVLSRLYLDSGQVAAAVVQCRSALATDPSDQTALYRLIRALKAEGSDRHQEEISQLFHRLGEARAQARHREEEISRYRLTEATSNNPAAKTK